MEPHALLPPCAGLENPRGSLQPSGVPGRTAHISTDSHSMVSVACATAQRVLSEPCWVLLATMIWSDDDTLRPP
eukprot:1058720-Pyramimonas_sp.AAC.1